MASSSHGQLLEDVIKRLATQDAGTLIWNATEAPSLLMFMEMHALTIINVPESRVKVEAATQLRDNLDVFTNMASYSVFLKKVMPVFVNILNGPCIFQSNSNEQVWLIPSHPDPIGLPLTPFAETPQHHPRDSPSIPYTSYADRAFRAIRPRDRRASDEACAE